MDGLHVYINIMGDMAVCVCIRLPVAKWSFVYASRSLHNLFMISHVKYDGKSASKRACLQMPLK